VKEKAFSTTGSGGGEIGGGLDARKKK